jgi:hypothetical protein
MNSGIQQPQSMPFRVVKKVTSTLTTGLVLVGLFAALGMWRSGGRFFEGLLMMIQPEVAEPEVDIRSVVVRQIRGASELTTAIYAMEAVVPAVSNRTLAGYTVGKTNLLYIAYGEVRAGVELGDLTESAVQTTGDGGVRVVLPPPQMLDSKIDVARSNVYDYSRGFLGLGPDTGPELQSLAQAEALRKIEESACAEGVLQEANQRAAQVVEQLLLTAGYTDPVVETQEPTADACLMS